MNGIDPLRSAGLFEAHDDPWHMGAAHPKPKTLASETATQKYEQRMYAHMYDYVCK